MMGGGPKESAPTGGMGGMMGGNDERRRVEGFGSDGRGNDGRE